MRPAFWWESDRRDTMGGLWTKMQIGREIRVERERERESFWWVIVTINHKWLPLSVPSLGPSQILVARPWVWIDSWIALLLASPDFEDNYSRDFTLKSNCSSALTLHWEKSYGSTQQKREKKTMDGLSPTRITRRKDWAGPVAQNNLQMSSSPFGRTRPLQPGMSNSKFQSWP